MHSDFQNNVDQITQQLKDASTESLSSTIYYIFYLYYENLSYFISSLNRIIRDTYCPKRLKEISSSLQTILKIEISKNNENGKIEKIGKIKEILSLNFTTFLNAYSLQSIRSNKDIELKDLANICISKLQENSQTVAELSFWEIIKYYTLINLFADTDEEKFTYNHLLQQGFENKFKELNEQEETKWQILYQKYGNFTNSPVKADNLPEWCQFCELLAIFETPGTLSSKETNLCGPTAILNILSFRAPNSLLKIYESFLDGRNDLSPILLVTSENDKKCQSIHLRLIASIKRGLNHLSGYKLNDFGSFEKFNGVTGTYTMVNLLKKLGAEGITDSVKIKPIQGCELPPFLLSLFGVGYSSENLKGNSSAPQSLGEWQILYVDIKKLYDKNSRSSVGHYAIGKSKFIDDNLVEYAIYNDGYLSTAKISTKLFNESFLGQICVEKFNPLPSEPANNQDTNPNGNLIQEICCVRRFKP